MSDPPSPLSDIANKEVIPTPSIMSDTYVTPVCSLEGSQSSLNAQELCGDESPPRGVALTPSPAHPDLMAWIADIKKRTMEQKLQINSPNNL